MKTKVLLGVRWDTSYSIYHRCFDILKRAFLITRTNFIPLTFQELNSLKPHENFRLWLTAESHPKFPTILLQTSLKVTYEVSVNAIFWAMSLLPR